MFIGLLTGKAVGEVIGLVKKTTQDLQWALRDLGDAKTRTAKVEAERDAERQRADAVEKRAYALEAERDALLYTNDRLREQHIELNRQLGLARRTIWVAAILALLLGVIAGAVWVEYRDTNERNLLFDGLSQSKTQLSNMTTLANQLAPIGFTTVETITIGSMAQQPAIPTSAQIEQIAASAQYTLTQRVASLEESARTTSVREYYIATWPTYGKTLFYEAPNVDGIGRLRYLNAEHEQSFLRFHDHSVFTEAGGEPLADTNYYVQRLVPDNSGIITQVWLTRDPSRAAKKP